MKQIITTVVGDFSVHMSYQPTCDDYILNRFTEVINKFAILPMVIASDEYPELDTITDLAKLSDMALSLMLNDESKIEDSLYQETKASNGAGQKVLLSLSSRTIILTRF